MRRAAWRPELGILFGCVLLLSLAWLHVALSADGGLKRDLTSGAKSWAGLRVVFSRGTGGSSDGASRPGRNAARRRSGAAPVGLESPLYQPAAPAPGGATDDGVPVTRVYFFAIVTQPLQFRRRRIIRSTWLHCLRADAARRGASGLPLRVELRYRFFIAGEWPPELVRDARRIGGRARLAAEMVRYRDIVPLAVTERYENLTRKSQALLQWVAHEWAAEAAAAAGDAGGPPLQLLRPAPVAPGGLDSLRQLRAYPNGSAFLSYLHVDNDADEQQLLLPTPTQFEAVDAELASNLTAALGGGGASDGGSDDGDDGVGGSGGGSGPGRPWGAPFAGVHTPGKPGVLEFFVKTDADVHYCPGHVLRYGPALLALHSGAAGLARWRNKDQPPEVTAAQMAAVHAPGAAPLYLWAGKGPYGNRTIIRCVCVRRGRAFRELVPTLGTRSEPRSWRQPDPPSPPAHTLSRHRRDPKNYYHLPPEAYPGPVEPPFVPGPSYMLSGHLLLALAGTFHTLPPQGVLDAWRGFEDRHLGMQVAHLAAVRGLPVRVLGRDDHYMDFASSQALLKSYAPPRPFCEAGWVPKLGAQVINYNESAPLPQFACPGWAWPGEGDDDPPLVAVPVDAAPTPDAAGTAG
jgi:hypothetical protein